MKIQCINQDRDKGLWMLNTSHLQNEEYVKQIQNINDHKREVSDKDSTTANTLEILKLKMIQNSQKWSNDFAKSKNKINQELQNKINLLIKEIQNSISPAQLKNLAMEMNNCKKQCENFYRIKTEGAIIRSKTKWYDQGEKCSKYFFALEKVKHSNKTMRAILLSDGSISRNQTKILKEQYNFYKKLYTSESNYKITYCNENKG